ncbi:TadE family protein [Microbacterium sp. MYb64]|uniref:TadE family protein n=1 Tax=Microbacterium sp. MYb64 TaxID=1848691 RepID=UPI000CFCCF10|nr:TadE family protein [Microbacterium sp. MYb64]
MQRSDGVLGPGSASRRGEAFGVKSHGRDGEQFALTVYVRNVVHDAAVEGTHVAALADTEDGEGVRRTELVISRAVGRGYAQNVTVRETAALGVPTMEVTVRTTLPLIGLLGVPSGMEVTGRAPVESFTENG